MAWRAKQLKSVETIGDWMRENVAEYRTPMGYMKSPYCEDVYYRLQEVREEILSKEEEYRQKDEKQRKESVEEGKTEPIRIAGDVPVIESWEEIKGWHTWIQALEDYGHPEGVNADIEEVLDSPFEIIADTLMRDSGYYEDHRIVWNDDAPDFIKPIEVEMGSSAGNYYSVSIWTWNGDHFLETSYYSSDGGFAVGRYEPSCLKQMYTDIFNYIKECEAAAGGTATD